MSRPRTTGSGASSVWKRRSSMRSRRLTGTAPRVRQLEADAVLPRDRRDDADLPREGQREVVGERGDLGDLRPGGGRDLVRRDRRPREDVLDLPVARRSRRASSRAARRSGRAPPCRPTGSGRPSPGPGSRSRGSRNAGAAGPSTTARIDDGGTPAPPSRGRRTCRRWSAPSALCGTRFGLSAGSTTAAGGEAVMARAACSDAGGRRSSSAGGACSVFLAAPDRASAARAAQARRSSGPSRTVPRPRDAARVGRLRLRVGRVGVRQDDGLVPVRLEVDVRQVGEAPRLLLFPRSSSRAVFHASATVLAPRPSRAPPSRSSGRWRARAG